MNSNNKNIYSDFPEYYDYLYGDPDVPLDQTEVFPLINWILENYNITNQSKILDMGSGTGRVLIPLTSKGYDILGYEPHKGMRNIATSKAEKYGITIKQMDGSYQSLNAIEKYDLIMGIRASFAHLINPGDAVVAFENITNALKPGGICVIDILNVLAILDKFKRPVMYEINLDDRKGKVMGRTTIDHIKSLWIHELEIYLHNEDESIDNLSNYQELAIVTPRELEILAHINNLQLLHHFQSYKEPIDDSKNDIRSIMIFQKN